MSKRTQTTTRQQFDPVYNVLGSVILAGKHSLILEFCSAFGVYFFSTSSVLRFVCLCFFLHIEWIAKISTNLPFHIKNTQQLNEAITVLFLRPTQMKYYMIYDESSVFICHFILFYLFVSLFVIFYSHFISFHFIRHHDLIIHHANNNNNCKCVCVREKQIESQRFIP